MRFTPHRPLRLALEATLPFCAPLLRVMEDDPQSMPMPCSQAADAVPEIDAIGAAGPFHRTMMHGEDHRIPLLQRHDLNAGLHPRTLLGQDELAAREVLPRL